MTNPDQSQLSDEQHPLTFGRLLRIFLIILPIIVVIVVIIVTLIQPQMGTLYHNVMIDL